MLYRLKNAALQTWARIRLFHCEISGPGVRLRGNPHVTSKGLIRLGKGVSIHSFLHRVQLSSGPGAVLDIGEDSFINNGTVLSARQHISIGKRCQVAPHVIIMDSDFHGVEERNGPPPTKPIVVEDDVWLATRSMILKGVTIGKGSVVAAGAVVTRDVPPFTMVAGVPARHVRSLKTHD